MGLLDQFSGLGNLNEDQTQGLLAAAAQMLQASGPSRTPASFGQVAGAGIGSYMAGSQASKQRRAEEEQARQLAAMRGLQMQGMQGELGDKELSRSKALELAELQKRFAQGEGSAMPSSAPAAAAPLGAQPMMSMPGQAQPMQPQPAQASGGGGGSVYEQQMSYAKFLLSNGKAQEALAVAKAAHELRPKYSTSLQAVQGADGKLRNIQVAEDGSKPVELAYDVKPEMVEVGLGDRTEFVDKNRVKNGQTFRRGVDPGTVYSGGITMRGQNMDDARKREEIAAGGKPPPGYRWTPGGTLAAIPGGPGDKLPESQQKQVVGVNNLSNAIREYRADLANFNASDALSMDSRAKMGTKYNNMMLQAKEAYNLGVLNGPDLEILTSVITDPRSMKGMLTSKAALDTQASELDRIMQGVGAVSGQARQPQNGGKPADSKAIAKGGGAPAGAVNMLRMNPKLREAFDAKYGAGAAASILGK